VWVKFGEFGVAVAQAGSTKPTCPGDITGDGIVNAQDRLTLLGAWGPNPKPPADLNGNGAVDAQDLLILLAAWGSRGCRISG